MLPRLYNPRQVIFPLDFEKTEQSERFMKTVETIIKERPDCVNPAISIPSPGERGPLASGGGAGAGGVCRCGGVGGRDADAVYTCMGLAGIGL